MVSSRSWWAIEPQDREAKPSPVTHTVDGGLVTGFIVSVFLHACMAGFLNNFKISRFGVKKNIWAVLAWKVQLSRNGMKKHSWAVTVKKAHLSRNGMKNLNWNLKSIKNHGWAVTVWKSTAEP
jgi:hypothetical protein